MCFTPLKLSCGYLCANEITKAQNDGKNVANFSPYVLQEPVNLKMIYDCDNSQI